VCTRRYALQPNSVPNTQTTLNTGYRLGRNGIEISGVGESSLRCIGGSIKFSVFLQKLGVPQQIKKFPLFKEAECPMPCLQERASYFLSWARWIQFTPSHAISLRYILIFHTLPRLDLPSCLFPSGLHTKTLYAFLFSPLRSVCSSRLNLHNFFTRMIFSVQ